MSAPCSAATSLTRAIERTPARGIDVEPRLDALLERRLRVDDVEGEEHRRRADDSGVTSSE